MCVWLCEHAYYRKTMYGPNLELAWIQCTCTYMDNVYSQHYQSMYTLSRNVNWILYYGSLKCCNLIGQSEFSSKPPLVD